MSTKSELAWAQFDALVAAAEMTSPWIIDGNTRSYAPDLALLEALLAVPIEIGCEIRSGIPAKAVDVWVAHELRRSRFQPDEVWPRATVPRVLPFEISDLLRQLPKTLAAEVRSRIESGKIRGSAASMDARVLGKAYEKQVDVVIARWSRGVELMVSTKRMDSSFSNNTLNRIEESYGDAKNLRARHPLSAIGFLFVIDASALTTHRGTVEKLMDLLEALAREDDAYDSTGLLIADSFANEKGRASVNLLQDEVPTKLKIEGFLSSLIGVLFSRTPITTHSRARELWLGHDLAVAREHE